MARHNGSGGVMHSTRQKGTANRRRSSTGTYSARNKARYADRYRRPYLTGEYLTWPGHEGIRA